ncbi:MAG: chorismate-binding protein, partial [Muribaculaceae bacterium]|nr:chorismate-binding protein [Muribaculaceae bacterium]
LHTLSMAGTRWADEESADWDEKNREEQGIVTDFITRTLRNAGLTSELYGPYTLNAGPVEHLATDIRASADKDTGFGLISRLSPTPALSGFPRSESIEFINRYENITLFQREMESNMPEGRDCKEKNSNVGDSKKCTRQCYGGVIGYTLPTDDFYSFANLRSGRLYTPGNKIILYAGGGITLRSNPEKEWEETEHKLSTLRNLIK